MPYSDQVLRRARARLAAARANRDQETTGALPPSTTPIPGCGKLTVSSAPRWLRL